MAMALIDRFAAVLTDEDVSRILEVRKAPTTPPIVEPPKPPTWVPGITKIATGRSHEYSTMYPGDDMHRWLLLRHLDGFTDLVNIDGSLVRTLPAQINTACQPQWRRRPSACFLFRYLNELREYNALTDTIRTVRKFSNLSGINGMGESDISADDDHMIFCDGLYVFIYELSTDRIITEFTAPGTFSDLYISANNEPIINLHSGGTQVFTGGVLKPLTPSVGHMDSGRTKDGRNVIIRTNSADRSGVPANCDNGIELVDINAETRTCLLPLHWDIAVHVSMPDNADRCLVTTYVPKDPNSPIQYANEILKVYTDGRGTVETVVKHGAVSDTYEGTPRASISRDGTHFVYDSKGDVYLGILA